MNETINTPRGSVSTLMQLPPGAVALLVLGHGAGADMRHHHMESLADALASAGIGTLRFNFPFKEAGGNRTDPVDVCVDTIANAVALAGRMSTLPLLLGGHSFGGRMASHYAAHGPEAALRGLIYFSFPLHPAGKTGTKRAAHLPDIALPQLFVSGTRDALADTATLQHVIADLPLARLHEIDTADHSFKPLKRSRTSTEDVYVEAARVARGFVDSISGGSA